MSNEHNERATKKQHELLSYIDGFIQANGYGPSYREVMRALDYKSVSTVATHVSGLIAKGYLEKTGNSARSLQVVARTQTESTNITWLRSEFARLRAAAEEKGETGETDLAALDRVAAIFGISETSSQ